jgi:hypothetical protein
MPFLHNKKGMGTKAGKKNKEKKNMRPFCSDRLAHKSQTKAYDGIPSGYPQIACNKQLNN